MRGAWRTSLAFLAASALAPMFAANAQAPTVAKSAAPGLGDLAGWHWYTIDEPKPRVSIFNAAGDGLSVKHGFVSMFQMGGDKWFDTVQELAPTGSGKYRSTYRYTDGRPPLVTIWTHRTDGSFLEEFTDAAGTRFRNIIRMEGNLQTIERTRLAGTEWSRINLSKKDGWSPTRLENARLAAERQAREFQRQMAEQARKQREEDAYWAQVDAEEHARERAASQRMAQSTPNAYEILTGMANKARADAERSQRQLHQTIARAQQQSRPQASSPSGSGGAVSHGDRVVAQEQARAEQLRREREARAAEERRQADAKAAADRQRAEEARRQAELARTRPVEWIEGVVLCEPRSGSKQWRCTGPLQMNILELDAPNTIAQLGLACGSSNGIREIGKAGSYRAYGCGFGIHPTAKNYPGNRDVPKDFGVYVSDRRVFHCPISKDAYCRNP